MKHKAKVIILSLMLIIGHGLTELHSIVYALDPTLADTEMDLFLDPSFKFDLSFQWYVKMFMDGFLNLLMMFIIAQLARDYSKVLFWVAVVYALYHILDLFMFVWNYKRTVGVYWSLIGVSTIGLTLLLFKKLYPPRQRLKKVE